MGQVQSVGEPEHGEDEKAERAIGREFLHDLDMAETLTELWQHIEGLIIGILDFWMKELPMRLQHHTIGIPYRWMWLLRRIARSITCYHENH